MLKKIHLTIGTRIYGLIALGFLGLLAVAFMDLHEMRGGLKRQKEFELQHLTELAVGIVKDEYAAAQRGDISTDEAKTRALARVANLRYGGKDYFFVQSMEGRMLMHPIATDLNGKDVNDLKDVNGKPITAQSIAVVRDNGSGFIDYVWPKPGASQPMPKLSYSQGFAPWGWIVTTGVYVDDLDAQAWAAAQRSLVAVAIFAVITLLISIFMARRITGPLHRMTERMKELAHGKLDVEVPGLSRRDEIGEMAQAVEVFKTNAVARQRLEAEQKEAEALAVARRKADMQQLANQFEAEVGGIIRSVSSAATELEASANTLTRTAETTQTMSSAVSSSSEEASTNVQTVASATHEMTASVAEIGRQVQTSSRIADEAVRQAQKTDARVNELSQAASRIGDVVKLITAIAEQTNLLALNATIEAARAGEAGKGFAVVAQEVKALAGQTGKATGEIAAQISAMQSATSDSVMAIKEIGGTIGQIAEIASAIAAAVEEQGAAIREISRNVQEAAERTTEVASHITEVSRAAEETGSASGEVLAAVGMLGSESSRLQREVDRFLNNVRVG